jgi:hypothetical protein
MADIGSTLRETRIRDKVDITTVEEATKIRAKYLRALENEEWSVLPGPAYVKSFLRTYAEFLGLDAHLLVEEYRARFEQPDDLELPAFTPQQPLRRRVRPPGPPSRAAVFAALAVGFIGVLFVLGITGGNDEDNAGSQPARTQAAKPKVGRKGSTTANPGARARNGKTAPGGGLVALSVVPARAVWVCLVDASGRARVEGRTLAAGKREGPFKSKRFKLTIGNGGGDFSVNGKLRDVPDRSTPLGYAISSSGTRLLPADQRPTCAPGSEQAGQPGTASP